MIRMRKRRKSAILFGTIYHTQLMERSTEARKVFKLLNKHFPRRHKFHKLRTLLNRVTAAPRTWLH